MTTEGFSNITTKMKVERVINGYKFVADVEVYNSQKKIKSLVAKVTKEGEGSSDMAIGHYVYTMVRGINMSNTPGSFDSQLPDGAEGEAILSAGIELEKVIDGVIASSEFSTSL